jgi:hypothetical protein
MRQLSIEANQLLLRGERHSNDWRLSF